MKEKFESLVKQYKDEIIKTASEMIQINSQSTQEGEFAQYVVKKMQDLDYDEVVVDTYGNVFGTVKGTGGGSSVMLNCHLDVVDEGDISKWKYPPYSGTIAEGRIWGRGASDTKGTFAIQIYAPIMLKRAGLLPKGDIVVAGVVCEEIAGFGAMMQAKDNFKLTDYAIVGEATENDLAIGCRGRFCAVVTITGKSCHASMPHMGKNPFDFLGKFLVELKTVEMGKDELFGSSTMSVTNIESSEKGTNIIPNELKVYIDYRQSSVDTEEVALAKIQEVIDRCKMEGITVDLKSLYFPLKTYTGFEGMAHQGEPPFSVSPEEPYVQLCKKTLEKITGHPIKTKTWEFATDTGHYAAKGVKCIGYSPAEIRLCHTTEDSIDINMMEEGTLGYLALAYTLANKED
ncbi:MAG TPA: M20 family metallopeptidase [Tepidanaerobacter syntrophicus]|uniref:M20 family metallopeptidase n=1 Tax=Tepidanaerobacter syntrophicus TaxID=224999 RepID=UPI00175DDDCA|nr:M20/M25/M40 family metallo-hydrolase [Tepidanaerobacter syntrophicus]HHV82176.1 M20 family metallopeptidase [Tepidanaerobacter syntrophicus]